MKRRLSPDKIVEGQETRQGMFGIDSGNLAHIFDILRNQLYADRVMACIREYSTNALDAQIEAGFEGQFRVSMPTNTDPNFCIRDFGAGLSEEDVMQVYCQYGSSTKRSSNAYNGMLGLGSKSAFAYSKSFTITSYFGGEKKIFNAYLDETLIGKISVMHTEASDEPTGIEIKIPVKPSDIYEFQRKAERVYRYFSNRPEILNYDCHFPKQDVLMEGEGWVLPVYNYGNSAGVAIMGNVAYPLDGNFIKNAVAKSLVQVGLEVHFEIGEVEIAASREALQYTPVTERTLNQRLTEIADEVALRLTSGLAEQKNIIEAVIFLKNAAKIGNISNALYQQVKSSAIWNGVQLSGFETNGFRRFGGISMREFHYDSRRMCLKSTATNFFYADSGAVFVENDEHLATLRPKIQVLRDRLVKEGNAPSRIYLIDFKGGYESGNFISAEDARQKWFDDNHWEDVPMVKMSDIPKPPRAPRGTGGTSARLPEIYTLQQGGYQDDSFWNKKTDVELKTLKGLYVPINRNKISSGCFTHSPSGLWSMISQLEDLGIKIPTIYGIKEGVLAKKKDAIPSTLKPLGTFLQDALKKIVAKLNVEEIVQARLIINDLTYEVNRYQSIRTRLEDRKTLDHPICTMYKEFNRLQNLVNSSTSKDMDNIFKLAKNMGMTLDAPSTTDTSVIKRAVLSEQLKQLAARYPMIRLTPLGSGYYRSVSKEDMDTIIDYLDMIDKMSE